MPARLIALLAALLVSFGGIAATSNPITIQIVDEDEGGEPSWFASMADKTWAQPIGNSIDDVKPVPTPGGNAGHAGVVSAYSGGTPSADGVYIFGGGHHDYGGNEVYLININTLEVERLSEPSTISEGSPATETAYADGQMRVPHSYGYVGVANGYLWSLSQSAPYSQEGYSTNTYHNVWRWPISSKGPWEFVGTLPGSTGSQAFGIGAAWCESRGLFYVLSQYGEIWTVNPSNGNRSLVGTDYSPGAENGSIYGSVTCIDQADALVLYTEEGTIQRINLDSLGSGWSAITVTGTFGITDAGPLFQWDPVSKKILAWGHSTNRTYLYTLAPPTADPQSYSDLNGTWTATAVTPDGSNSVTPSIPSNIGIFQRGGLVPVGDTGRYVWIVLNSTTEDPYVYKIPASGL